MSVPYKFKNSRNDSTKFIQFDGGAISVGDLKRAIAAKEKLGYSSDYDLVFTHAQTSEGKLKRVKRRMFKERDKKLTKFFVLSFPFV
jgi:hypothetical protein